MGKEPNETEKYDKKGRDLTIIVNTREKDWDKKEISYQDVIILAFDSYSDDANILYTVAYSRGPEQNHEGTMVKGQSVKVKNEMVFNVTRTDKS